MPLGTHLLSWNGVWRARNEITRILNAGSVKVETKFNIRFHKVWTNKENNVSKDAIGVKGLGFKHHGNHQL